MSSQRKRKRMSGTEVEVWKPLHDIPLIIENIAGTSLSIAVFVRNKAAARAEDEYVAWKVFNLSSPGSANLVYTRESAVGVICMEVQGVVQPPNTAVVADVAVGGNATRPTAQVRATVAIKRGSSSISKSEETESSSHSASEADELNGGAVAVAEAAVKVGVANIQTVGPMPCKGGSTYMFLPPIAGRVKCDLQRGKFYRDILLPSCTFVLVDAESAIYKCTYSTPRKAFLRRVYNSIADDEYQPRNIL